MLKRRVLSEQEVEVGFLASPMVREDGEDRRLGFRENCCA
jgi:hypothetical protein